MSSQIKLSPTAMVRVNLRCPHCGGRCLEILDMVECIETYVVNDGILAMTPVTEERGRTRGRAIRCRKPTCGHMWDPHATHSEEPFMVTREYLPVSFHTTRHRKN